ncbi:hypothetical protein BDV41DRAFT_537081 [Aspergillus transmontanensis]|uniref:Uncharacterized protein n=1 Tax=Aspergillus transmontanensis TaxID=1034304 RepID=A0A5N6VYH6_9EURO|nr:hypothetical protein BDV41DRAFT_537081 [Aspergillus transmontanensis]
MVCRNLMVFGFNMAQCNSDGLPSFILGILANINPPTIQHESPFITARHKAKIMHGLPMSDAAILVVSLGVASVIPVLLISFNSCFHTVQTQSIKILGRHFNGLSNTPLPFDTTTGTGLP